MPDTQTNWAALIQNLGIGTTIALCAIIIFWQFWKKVWLPSLQARAEINQQRAEAELEAQKQERENRINKEKASIEAIEMQTKVMADLGSVFKRNKEDVNRILESIEVSSKQIENIDRKFEALAEMVLEDQKLKRAFLVVMKALKKKGDLDEATFKEINDSLGGGS